MCFTKNYSGQTAVTAREDIYSVKYLKFEKGKLISPYRNRRCTWKVGVIKKASKFDASTAGVLSVNIGLHSHRLVDTAVRSAVNGTYAGNIGKVFIAKIPKGALYYINTTEICSNQLVLVKDITPKKERVKKKK